MILREHIEEFGTAADGRLFRTATGGMIFDTTHTWAVARTLALTPEQVASPLAARPYDLRHAAVSLWLNGGVAATEVANQAGVWFPAGPFCFRRLAWGNASRSIPRISRDQRQISTVGCIWLRPVTDPRREISGHRGRSEPAFAGQSGGRGIRTHEDVAALMVFKTIAIGH